MAVCENMTFLCDKVMIDGERLLPLDPAVKFVFLRIDSDVEELQFVYKDSNDPSGPERRLNIKWEHICGTSNGQEFYGNLITLRFNRRLCGYSLCNLMVSDVVYERLINVLDLIYFYIMRNDYGLTEEQARENIRHVYVYEDDNFGSEDDYPQNVGNADNVDHAVVNEGEGAVAVDDKNENSELANESESTAQVAVEENVEKVEPLMEAAEEKKDSAVCSGEKNGVAQEKCQGDSVVQPAAEENAEKESPVYSDEKDANPEEKVGDSIVQTATEENVGKVCQDENDADAEEKNL